MYMLVPPELHLEVEDTILSTTPIEKKKIKALKLTEYINSTRQHYHKFMCVVFKNKDYFVLLLMDSKNHSKLICLVPSMLNICLYNNIGYKQNSFYRMWLENYSDHFKVVTELLPSVRQARYRKLVNDGEDKVEALAKVPKRITYIFAHNDFLAYDNN